MTTLLRFAVVVILSVLALDVGAAFAETPQKESKKQSGSESDKSNSKNPAEKKAEKKVDPKKTYQRAFPTKPVPTPTGTPYAEPSRAPVRNTNGTEPQPAAERSGAPRATIGESQRSNTAAAAKSGAAATSAAAVALPASGLFGHNNSTMRLVTEGDTVRLLYETPRSGLGDLGIKPGTELFNGRKIGPSSYAGQATTFSPKQCGPTYFAVAGEASGNGRQVTLRGQAPVRNASCQVTGNRSENLVFVLQ